MLMTDLKKYAIKAPFVYEEKTIKRGDIYRAIIRIIIRDKEIAIREVGGKSDNQNIRIEGDTYEELIAAARQKGVNDYEFFNVTNLNFSAYFNVAGWQVSREQAEKQGSAYYGDYFH
jgi:hypothetical protein